MAPVATISTAVPSSTKAGSATSGQAATANGDNGFLATLDGLIQAMASGEQAAGTSQAAMVNSKAGNTTNSGTQSGGQQAEADSVPDAAASANQGKTNPNNSETASVTLPVIPAVQVADQASETNTIIPIAVATAQPGSSATASVTKAAGDVSAQGKPVADSADDLADDEQPIVQQAEPIPAVTSPVVGPATTTVMASAKTDKASKSSDPADQGNGTGGVTVSPDTLLSTIASQMQAVPIPPAATRQASSSAPSQTLAIGAQNSLGGQASATASSVSLTPARTEDAGTPVSAKATPATNSPISASASSGDGDDDEDNDTPVAAAPSVTPPVAEAKPSSTPFLAQPGSTPDKSVKATETASSAQATTTNSINAADTSSVIGTGSTASTGGLQASHSGSMNAASLTSASGQSPAEQVSLVLHRAVADKASSVTVALDPADLGKVEVKLDFAKDGSVQANIIADRQDTLNMLKSDHAGLHQALQNAGLSTDSSSLSFNLRGDGQNQQAQQGGKAYQSRTTFTIDGVSDSASPSTSSQYMSMASDGHVDVRV